MASGKRDPSSTEPKAPGRRRRAPTIELTATEVEPGATDASKASEPQAAATSTEPRPATETTSTEQVERPKDAQQSEPISTDEPSAPPPAGGEGFRWLPLQLSRSQIAAAAVGGAVVLVVFAAIWLFGVVRSRNGDSAALASKLDVLQVQVRDLNDRVTSHTLDPKMIEDVLARLTSLEHIAAAAKTSAPNAALEKRVAAAESTAVAAEKAANAAAESAAVAAEKAANAANKVSKTLDGAIKDIDRHLKELTAAASDARQRGDAATAAIAELQKKIASMPAGQVERGSVDRLAERIAKLETAAKTIQNELATKTTSGAGDRAVRLAVAAGALRAAVERGRPFTAELKAVTSLTDAAGVLAPLARFAATGLPDKAALAHDLSQLVPAMRRAAGSEAGEAGFLQRLQSNAEKLVRIRPINDVAGDDPGAIVSRVELRAGRADIAGALAELAKLPPAVRAPANAWIAKAKARMAAERLSRRFTAQAIAALAKPSP